MIPRVLSFIDSSYWAMYTPAYEAMREIVASHFHVQGHPDPLTREEKNAAIEAAQAARNAQIYRAPTTIAILNMFGIISPRAGMMDDVSQEGCPMDSFCAKWCQAMRDPNVAGVIVNVDTPGGNVYQVPESADMIRGMRDVKPNVGVVTGMCASAGFWVAAQFAELVGCPSSEIGSIGVLMQHKDLSKMAETAGLKTTYITSPRDGYKSEGNPYTPIGDDTVEWYNSKTDEYYDMFLSGLVAGRGVSSSGNKSAASIVDQNWGRGRLLGARHALSLGMIDRVGTMQDEVDRMVARIEKKKGGSKMKMQEEDGAVHTAIDGDALRKRTLTLRLV